MSASRKYPTSLIDFRVFFTPVSLLKIFWSKSYIFALFNRWGGWPTWSGIRRQFHYNSGSHRSRHHVCNQLVLGDTTTKKLGITRLSRSGVEKSLFRQTTVGKKKKKGTVLLVCFERRRCQEPISWLISGWMSTWWKRLPVSLSAVSC